MKHSVIVKIQKTIRSNIFFAAILGLFTANAGWIAISGRYPMAHDENFHLGLIRLYSERWLPFWSSNPPGEALYGAVARDPSYMYHYLLSFPYRLLERAVPSEIAQVIILRFVSIAVVATGIWVFRNVLQRAGFSRAVVNVTLFLVVCTPMVPFFSAQLNYDPVIFLMSAVVIRLTQKLLSSLRDQKTLDSVVLLQLALACMFGSLVKYAFLPIVLAAVIIVAWYLYKAGLPLRKIWGQAQHTLAKVSLPLRIGLISLVLVFGGLFVERYGVNTIQYRTPTPECDQVIGVDACMAYSPWRRNYLTRQSYKQGTLKTKYPSHNFVNYVVTIWGLKTTAQLFFAIDGAASNYQAAKPYRVMRVLSLGLLFLGTALLAWHRRILLTQYRLGLFLLVIGMYMGALLAQNYIDFLTIGFPYAIQGRYFLPVLPLVYILFAQAYATTLAKYRTAKWLVTILIMAVFLTQGGGAGVYISRSNPGWWWQNQRLVQFNQRAQNLLRTIIIGN